MFPYLPELKENETLYGWVGRFHRLSGNDLAVRTSRNLFGDDFSAFRLDFPTELEYFATATDMTFGSAESLAMSHSTLPAFSPFLPHEGVREVIKYMMRGSLKPIKDYLGVTANKIGIFPGMKACPDCVAEDMEEEFISTWHLGHQLPGTWICLKHGRLLEMARHDLFPARNYKLILPHEITQSGWYGPNQMPEATLGHLAKVARFVSYFFLSRKHRFNTQLLRFAYLLRISDQGLVKADGSVEVGLWESFEQYYLGLQEMPEINCAKLEQELQLLMFNLMGRYNHRSHPIRHYLLMTYLFDSPADLIHSYNQVCAAYRAGGLSGLRELFRQNVLARNAPSYRTGWTS